MERNIIMLQITNICQVPYYSQSGAASPQGSWWLRLRWWFAKSGTVRTEVWIQEVSSNHRKWTRFSACQQEISNHFSDTKATGISCLSVGEGLWGNVQTLMMQFDRLHVTYTDDTSLPRPNNLPQTKHTVWGGYKQKRNQRIKCNIVS